MALKSRWIGKWTLPARRIFWLTCGLVDKQHSELRVHGSAYFGGDLSPFFILGPLVRLVGSVA
jgi:hypothetical protein